jgi:hypothetical protein
LPVIISTWTNHIVKRRTIRRVPLHSPTDGSRLRNNITSAPILNDNLCEGMSLTSKVLRNLKGYVLTTSVSFVEFTLRKYFFFWNAFMKGVLSLTPLPPRKTIGQTCTQKTCHWLPKCWGTWKGMCSPLSCPLRNPH